VSTRPVIADMLADAHDLLDGGVDGLTALLDEVASYGEQPVPTPSPELALLLAGRPAGPQRPAAAPVRLRARRSLAGLAAAATVSGLSLTGAAAVANELPAPMQRAVAHISEQHLPFSFPRPVGDPPVPGGSIGTAPGQDGAGQDGAGTHAAPGQAETGTAKTGQVGLGGESRGRTSPGTGPTRTSGSPPDRSGKTDSTGATGAAGDAQPTRTGHAEAVRGAEDDRAEPRSGPTSEPGKPDTSRGHAHAGSGSSGKGTEASPPRPAHPPKGDGSAPAGRGIGAGSGAAGPVPDATKVPNRAPDPTGASAASSSAHPGGPDGP
jgi:hypothetical protein